MKTLIVEDDFIYRVLLQRCLAPCGEIHLAASGKEALQAYRLAIQARQPYDLICLDIMMPGMNGHEVLKQIRAEEQQKGVFSTQGVKIVMVTALREMKHIVEAYQSLCDGYITKPIDRVGLFRVLKQLGMMAAAPSAPANASGPGTATHANDEPVSRPSSPNTLSRRRRTRLAAQAS